MPLTAEDFDLIGSIEKKYKDQKTAEENTKNDEIMQAAFVAEGGMQKMTEEVEQIFATADKNGDGELDCAEFIDYQNKTIDAWKGRGMVGAYMEESDITIMFHMFNKYNTDTAGIALPDLKAAYGEMMVHHAAKKAAEAGTQ